MIIKDWTPIELGLPLQEYSGEKVIDEFLVTVELNKADINKNREVMILWFCAKRGCFSRKIGLLPYEDENSSWHIVAWMPKPNPYPYDLNKI